MKVSGSVTATGLFPEDKKRKSEGRNISSLVGEQLRAHKPSLSVCSFLFHDGVEDRSTKLLPAY